MSSLQEVQVMPRIIHAAGTGLLLLNFSADAIASPLITHPLRAPSGASGFLDGLATGSASGLTGGLAGRRTPATAPLIGTRAASGLPDSGSPGMVLAAQRSGAIVRNVDGSTS